MLSHHRRSWVGFVLPIINRDLERRLSVECNVDVVGDVPPSLPRLGRVSPGHHHLRHPVDVEQGLGAAPLAPPRHVDRLDGLVHVAVLVLLPVVSQGQDRVEENHWSGS